MRNSVSALAAIALLSTVSTVAAAGVIHPHNGGVSSGNRSTTANLDYAKKAFQTIIQSKEFIAAEKTRDTTAMRRLLSGTGVVVADPTPELIPNCVPPYGTVVYGWVWVSGPGGPHSVYGPYCSRGSTVTLHDPIPYPSE